MRSDIKARTSATDLGVSCWLSLAARETWRGSVLCWVLSQCRQRDFKWKSCVLHLCNRTTEG